MKLHYLLLLVTTSLGALLLVTEGRSDSAPAPAAPAAITPLIDGGYTVAAPGKVEPASEEIAVGAPLTGLLKEVLVKEGDTVKRGEVVARLDTDPFRATLAKAEATLQLREAELRRALNGARPQERDEAKAGLQQAEAVLKTAGIELERRRALVKQGYVSREAADLAEREYAVAQQKREAARQHFLLVNDPAREEDIAIAEAQVAAAKAERDRAQADLDQAVIRSPIDGTVLRVNRRVGEVISVFLDPTVLTVGDMSHLFVRADVDEADIAKLTLGMPAYVTAEAFGEERFPGHVVRIGHMLGKKSIRTDEAKERTDTKVLQVLIALDDGRRLPSGLRVNAFMTAPQVSSSGSQTARQIATR
ncbi:MAG TPA: efflux RND transporter periplasmic adaptor subunit [Stellaceae bacterium]|nr:efflux RND transporter periplasmic adaptor subunit [Stellaceae bacterium]